MTVFSRSSAGSKRAAAFFTPDKSAYTNYYKSQAGGTQIPKFVGAGSRQFGYGLGSLLRSFWRTVVPVGRRLFTQLKPIAAEAFSQAKPVLKEAATDIAKETAKKIGRKISSHFEGSAESAPQEGSGRKRKRVQSKRKVVKKAANRRKRSKAPPKKIRTKNDFIRSIVNSAGPADIF